MWRDCECRGTLVLLEAPVCQPVTGCRPVITHSCLSVGEPAVAAPALRGRDSPALPQPARQALLLGVHSASKRPVLAYAPCGCLGGETNLQQHTSNMKQGC